MLGLKESQYMQPRITVITIGVDDLERALRFYRDGLGLATEGIIGREFAYGAVVFIELQAGVRLALWPLQLGRDAFFERRIPPRGPCAKSPRIARL
jgi:catechol 2,3-dioxygenase-like lactoylglutathione lyase family enzyme